MHYLLIVMAPIARMFFRWCVIEYKQNWLWWFGENAYSSVIPTIYNLNKFPFFVCNTLLDHDVDL